MKNTCSMRQLAITMAFPEYACGWLQLFGNFQRMTIPSYQLCLPAQTMQFGSLFGSQAVRPPDLIQVVLITPSCGWLARLARTHWTGLRGPATDTNEVDHLLI